MIKSPTAYEGELNMHGYLVLRAPAGRDPEELRAFGAKRYRGTNKWVMPLRLAEIERMAAAGLEVDLPKDVWDELQRQDRVTRFYQSAKQAKARSDNPHPRWDELMDHQRVSAGFLASRDRALLSLVPGLGKTASAIVTADIQRQMRILVVAPLTLLPTWRREIQQWSTDPSHAVLGNRAWDLSQRWTITNPEKLATKQGQRLYTLEWDLLILDESILYKNARAKRTKNVGKLAEQSNNVWMLSGAPVAAYADDLFAQLQVLRPDVFTSYTRFRDQWCITRVTPWATEVVGNRDPEGLRYYLRDLMLSRTAEDLPGMLPDTLFEVVNVELNPAQIRLVQDIQSQMAWEDDEGQVSDITAHIAQLVRLQQAVSCPRNLGVNDNGAKIGALTGLLKDGVAQLPALVWVHFRATGEAVSAALETAGYRTGWIHGQTTAEQRERALGAFRDGQLNVLIMQIQTGKFGLSLTETNSVVFVDRSFSYDDWTQSIARVRRLSSKGKVVPTYVLHGEVTDNLVDVILNRKLRSVHDLSLSDLREILGGSK